MSPPQSIFQSINPKFQIPREFYQDSTLFEEPFVSLGSEDPSIAIPAYPISCRPIRITRPLSSTPDTCRDSEDFGYFCFSTRHGIEMTVRGRPHLSGYPWRFDPVDWAVVPRTPWFINIFLVSETSLTTRSIIRGS